jgi:hypothetical protein
VSRLLQTVVRMKLHQRILLQMAEVCNAASLFSLTAANYYFISSTVKTTLEKDNFTISNT